MAALAGWERGAAAQTPDPLDELAARALELSEGSPRFVQSFKKGLRSATYSNVMISASDPSTLYVASLDGFVFGTQDRGLTWNEGRLVVKRRRFYGSIRPAPVPSGAPFSTAANIRDLHGQSRLTFDIDKLLNYPYDPQESNFLTFSTYVPEYYAPLVHPYLRDPSDIKLYDSGGEGSEGGDIARLGVGLKTAAVYLAALLRKRRKRVLTMNLQLTLAIKGVEPTGIQFLGIHPERPNEVLAASHMGLWRSEDFGMSWVVAFPGATRKERTTRHVIYRPDDPSQVFLSTDQGLRISRDGGHSFQPIKGTQLSSARAQWIEFAPSQPDTVYAGSMIGAFRSDDGGRTWRWIYFETLPTQNDVSAIAVDPLDADRVTLSTYDGLFRSSDGGETWERAGGLLFTGVKVKDIATNPRDGNHLICITSRQVWESRDWGETWIAVYLNDSEWWFRDVRFDPHDPGVFWIVSSNEILRVSSSRAGQRPLGNLAAYRERERVEPSLWETMEATFKTLGVHLGEHAEIRALASPSAWAPRVNLMAGVMQGDAVASFDVSYFNAAGGAGLLDRAQRLRDVYAFAVLQWDLDRAVFDLDMVPYGRIYKTAHDRYRLLRSEVQRLYEERRRLLLELLTSPRRDLAGELFLRLRIEELTAHLNALTGGLWEPSAHWLAALP